MQAIRWNDMGTVYGGVDSSPQGSGLVPPVIAQSTGSDSNITTCQLSLGWVLGAAMIFWFVGKRR